jgi:hypothetical protein
MNNSDNDIFPINSRYLFKQHYKIRGRKKDYTNNGRVNYARKKSFLQLLFF